VGEAGFAEMPGGSVARVSTFGGQGLTISGFSRHPQEDAALIRFLLRKGIQSFQNGALENLSSKVTYGGADTLRANKASPLAEASRANVVSRPTEVAPQVYDQVSKAYSGAIHSVISGEKGASEAASELEQDLVKITGLQPGPPERE
jgi:trehalose/maltose transport system substrate-binding protein